MLSVCIPTAPSGSPGVPMANIIMSTSITINWTKIDASNRNGIITSYVIQYGERMSQKVAINTMSNDTNHLIRGLKPFTLYTFAVAGVNSVGTGPYSDAIIRTAEDSKFTQIVVQYIFTSQLLAKQVLVSGITVSIYSLLDY